MKKITVAALVALSLGSSVAHAGWDEGVAAFQAKRYADAVREFEGVVAERPEWPGGHLMLGRALLKLDKAQQAVAALRKAYDIDPNSPQTKMVLGQAYLEAKRYQEAANVLKGIDPAKLDAGQRATFHQLNAAAMSGSGQADGAFEALQRAAAGSPNDANLHHQLGLAALGADNITAAVAALEKANRLKAGDPAILSAYVKALLTAGREAQGATKTGHYQKAIELAQQLVTKANTYENVLTLGEAQLGAKAYREAVATFERAKGLKPGDWLPAYYIGQAQTALAQYPQAEQTLNGALRSASGDAATKITKQLAFVYQKQKKYDEAVAAYRRVGDEAAATRVIEQRRVEEENKLIDQQIETIKELEREQKALQQQMKQVPPG
jgi:tetratricopeptide (TPR) repeat protein